MNRGAGGGWGPGSQSQMRSTNTSQHAATGLKPAALGLSPGLILARMVPSAQSLRFSLNSQSYLS